MRKHPDAFDRLLKLRPTDALLWYISAEHHVLNREYLAAIADFTRGGEPPATSEFAFVFAATLLLSGDDSAYRDYVIRQAQLHGASSEPATLFFLARMAMLAEYPPVAPDRFVLWANRAIEKEPNTAWFAHVQTMALFRAGELESAAKSHEVSRRLGWSPGGRALNEVLTAMLERRRGHGSSAMTAFAAARVVFASAPTVHNLSDLVLTDWLEFEILRKEIEGPLEDAVFPDDPFAGGMREARPREASLLSFIIVMSYLDNRRGRRCALPPAPKKCNRPERSPRARYPCTPPPPKPEASPAA